MWSARPLRLEELAAATGLSINLDYTSMQEAQATVSMDMERDLNRQLGSIVATENGYGRIASPIARAILAKTVTKKQLDLLDHSELTTLCLRYLGLALSDGCLENQAGFLDYACRFWPVHLLMVKNPDKYLKDTVVKFLLDPKLGERWFKLYLQSNSQTINPLSPEYEPQGSLTGKTQPESPTAIDGEKTKVAIASPNARKSNPEPAVSMACYTGLTSIIPELLGANHRATELDLVRVRRGSAERTIAFLDKGSRYYMECAISNDDDRVVSGLIASKKTASTSKLFPLHTAALVGSVKTTKMLYNMKDKLTEVDDAGRTPLHSAAIGGSTKIIEFLLGEDTAEHKLKEKGAQKMIDVQDLDRQTPLILAARMGHAKATKLLIASGSDTSCQDLTGKDSPLHYAVVSCDAAVEDLAAHDVGHVRDNDSCTPLHIATKSGCPETTSILVDALNASGRLDEVVNAEDREGKTPLQHAAEGGHTKILDGMFRHGGVGVGSSNYIKAAELAAACGHLSAVQVLISSTEDDLGSRLLVAASRAGQLLVVQYLLTNGIPVDGLQSLDSRPLSEAASKGHIEIVRALLGRNASVNIEDAKRKTPLHHAAENGMEQVAMLLLSSQANVDAPDVDRKTPLHSAASAGRASVIKRLLGYGAKVQASSRTKETPLHLAVKNEEAVEVLLNARAEPNVADMIGQTPLHIATRGKHLASARLLLSKDANVNARDNDGHLPLYYAISQDDLPMVKELCKSVADLCSSTTEMEWAIQSAAVTVFEYALGLIRENADESNNLDGLLRLAAGGESIRILELLLELGIDANSKWHDETPLHNAARSGRVKNIRLLLDNRANVNAIANDGGTPSPFRSGRGPSRGCEAVG